MTTETTKAVWNISLDCECPHCKKDVDLTDDDAFYEGVQVAQDGEFEVYCPECGEDFTVGAVY